TPASLSRSAPPSAPRSSPSPSSHFSATAPPAPSRERSGGSSASRSPHSSPPSPSPPAGPLERTDMQPMPPEQSRRNDGTPPRGPRPRKVADYPRSTLEWPLPC